MQVPLAGVFMHQVFIGKYTGGADLHQVAGELALQYPLLMAAEVNMVVRGQCGQVGATGVVTVVTGAAVAGDTAVHFMVDQWPQVLIAMRILAAAVAAITMAYHHRHVLQVALPPLSAYRAVVGVVQHQ